MGMAIGVMLAGIVAGLMGAVWALASGYSVLVAMALYPVAGIAGVLTLLPLVLFRINATDGEPTRGLQEAH